MAWVAVDKDSLEEYIYDEKPERGKECWLAKDGGDFLTDTASDFILLPFGSILRLTGHKLGWEDEPVELV